MQLTPRSLLAIASLAALGAGGCGALDPSTTDGGGDDLGGDGTGVPAGAPAMPAEFAVTLEGPAGVQRVSFAIPLPPGAIVRAADVRISDNGRELPAARRAIGRHGDGSPRSVQIQVDVDPSVTRQLAVQLGAAGAGDLAPVPVEQTLTGGAGSRVPRVWARLPPAVLAASGVVGPVAPRGSAAAAAGGDDAWAAVCDYERWGTDAFLPAAGSREAWLYDRVTAMYRGYAITGELAPLRSAYREAGIYRAGIAISGGEATSIAVPGAAADLKYHYAQGLAIHYLLTGDDRYREAAEAIAARAAGLWDPHYDGGDRFWTERHAGFALLAQEWAARVSDDRAGEAAARADADVTAFLGAQRAALAGADPDARCFAHTAAAHGEPYGTVGCSPWMSAILADALDAYATRVGGDRAADVRAALARLGRAIARRGRDGSGRPYYWLALGGAPERDPYDEHWGESAYVTALAWQATGRAEPALRDAAIALSAGLRDRGEVGQLRSFNWQCRSAVMTPALLR